jgi:hypothetical protein
MKLLRAFHAIVILLLLVACAAPSSDAQSVYITKTGSKYHRGSCQYLRKSKFEIPLKEAVARGYDPCSVCEPGVPSREQKSIPPSDPTQTKTKSSSNTTTSSKQKEVKSRQCTATTKAGTRCKRMTTSASGKCYQHE